MPTNRETLFYSPEISPSMIFHHLEKFHFSSLFDPISSTSGGAGYFKLQNIRVISNDQSLFAYTKGKALWENNSFYIPDKTIEEICKYEEGDLKNLARYHGFDYPHLTDEMKAFLDLWNIRIQGEQDEYVKALLNTAVLLCIDYWISMYEHGIGPSFDPPSLLRYYLGHVNRQVMDNHESNEMWHENPHELTEKVLADAIYLNPPPLKGYASFGLRERIAECWLRGDAGFDMGNVAREGTLGSACADADAYMDALADFFKRASHIHLWIIALSYKQPFTQVGLNELLSHFNRKIASIDVDLPPGFFTPRAVNTVIVASG